MKSKLTLVSIGYILSLGILVISTYFYIENKKEKLRNDIRNQIDLTFSGKRYLVDTYSYNSADYSICENPGKEKMISEKKYNEMFPDLTSNRDSKAYGDIYKSYKITEGGWTLSVAEYDGWRLMTYYISPVYVCYLKQSDSYMYEYMPSVLTALDEAHKFWTENEKSQYSNGYRKGCKSDISNLPYINNDYYNLKESGSGEWSDYAYMHNGYYRIFNGSSKILYYEINLLDSKVKTDWITILCTGLVLISVLYYLSTRKDFVKLKKEKSENLKVETYTLLDELKEKCNPANFMNPYNKEKVEKANLLYPEILSCTLEDIELQKTLRTQAISELGITFYTSKVFNELKNKCNPQRFMNPYNSEKVNIANRLYERLLQNEHNIEMLEDIKKEADEFLN